MSPGLHGADSRPQVLLHSGEQLSPAPLRFSQGLAASSRNTRTWLQSSGGLTTAKQPSPRLFIQGQHLSPQLHATAQTRLWSHSASHRTPSPNQPSVPRQGLSRNGSVCPEVFYPPHVADPIPGRTPLEAPPQVPAGWDALGSLGQGPALYSSLRSQSLRNMGRGSRHTRSQGRSPDSHAPRRRARHRIPTALTALLSKAVTPTASSKHTGDGWAAAELAAPNASILRSLRASSPFSPDLQALATTPGLPSKEQGALVTPRWSGDTRHPPLLPSPCSPSKFKGQTTQDHTSWRPPHLHPQSCSYRSRATGYPGL